MQVTETLAEGLKREFKIVVPADELDAKVTDRLKDVAKTIALPGFRPGKVPVALLKKRYGQSVLGEVLEETVNETSRQAMEERELRPVMQPRIEVSEFDRGGDLEYTMAVELFPDIEPMDFSSLDLERMVVEVDENEVAQTLERLAESHKTSQPVADADHAAAAGEVVVLDFVGKLDGEEFPGGKAEDYRLELGSNTFIPGFEDQVVGAKAGEERQIDVTFPEDYGAENLAGKAVVFEIKVKEILTTAAAVIDDDLAKKMGQDSLEALKDTIRGEHRKQYDSLARLRLKRTLLDALADGHAFEVPPGMVEAEAESVSLALHEEDGPIDPEAVDEEEKPEVTEEHRSLAERRVRLGLLLAEVGRINNLEVSPEDLNRALMSEASRYPGQEQAVMDFYRQNPQMMDQIKAPIFEDKVCDFILEMARITDKPVSLEELQKDPDADDAATVADTAKTDEEPAK